MKKIRLLLADDNPLVLEMLSRLLSGEDRVVGTVPDGKALITAAAEMRPDIVISDIDMPFINGLEAARQLRQLLPQTRVILMSGHDGSEYVAGAVAAGACAFVSKGKVEDLRKTFNDIISHVLEQPASEELVGQGMTGARMLSF